MGWGPYGEGTTVKLSHMFRPHFPCESLSRLMHATTTGLTYAAPSTPQQYSTSSRHDPNELTATPLHLTSVLIGVQMVGLSYEPTS